MCKLLQLVRFWHGSDASHPKNDQKGDNPMKKTIALLLTLMFLLSLPSVLADDKVYSIGIAQFGEHASLDNCRKGFVLGMQENGFEEGVNVRYTYQNAVGDTGIAAIIASSFVDNRMDLILAIATPMAKIAHTTADGAIPVIYSAVSAPVEAELADEQGLGINTTGTSDILPVDEQLKVIREMLPDAKSIGILYTLSEVNSGVQLRDYEKTAGTYGFEIVSQGITVGADIALAVPQLINKVDCMTMLLDNTVVQYLDVVLDQTDEIGIPVFGSEIEQVRRGCVASVGLDYIKLGRQTGALAARVLKGEDASTIPFEIIDGYELYINSTACERLGIVLSDEIQQRAHKVEPL